MDSDKANLLAYLQEKKARRTDFIQTCLHQSVSIRYRHQQKRADRAKERYQKSVDVDCKSRQTFVKTIERPLLKVQSASINFCTISWEVGTVKMVYITRPPAKHSVPAVSVCISVKHCPLVLLPVILEAVGGSLDPFDRKEEVNVGVSVQPDGETREGCEIEISVQKIWLHPVCSQIRRDTYCLDSEGGSGDAEISDWEYCSGSDYDDAEDDDIWEYYTVQYPVFPRGSKLSPYSREEIDFDFNEDTLRAAQTLSDLVPLLFNKEHEILRYLQEKYQPKVGKAKTKAQLKPRPTKYTGKKDKQGKYHGEGELSYSNGATYTGQFKHGLRSGFGMVTSHIGDVIEGNFQDDKLEGWAIETYNQTGWRQKYFSGGEESGFFRDIDASGYPLKFGIAGDPCVWIFSEGGSAMFGPWSDSGQGGEWENGGEVLYLYPGYKLGILGTFVQGKLKSGTECVLAEVGYSRHGLLTPVAKKVVGGRCLSYEHPGTHCPARNVNLTDIWDILHVYVAESSLPCAGEGLFAKIFLEKDSLVCLFNGARKRKLLRCRPLDEEHSSYSIKLDSDTCIDIPDHYVAVSNYSATLAHKACHSFKNNAAFSRMEHPRFGRIMCIKAITDILPGEEIFVNYNYSVEKAPEWYQEAWFSFLRRDLGWPAEVVADYGLQAATCSAILKSISTKVNHLRATTTD